jgi:hypothetical protein
MTVPRGEEMTGKRIIAVAIARPRNQLMPKARPAGTPTARLKIVTNRAIVVLWAKLGPPWARASCQWVRVKPGGQSLGKYHPSAKDQTTRGSRGINNPITRRNLKKIIG